MIDIVATLGSQEQTSHGETHHSSSALKIAAGQAASLPLDERKPFGPPLGTPLDGPMETARRQLWKSADETVSAGIWECERGRFHNYFDGEGELIHVVSGRLTCLDDEGQVIRLGPGDVMTFPPDWRGEWRIDETFRKLFVGFRISSPVAQERAAEIAHSLVHLQLDGDAVTRMPLDSGESFSAVDGRSLGTRSRTSWRSGDGRIETGVWEIDAGSFHADFGTYGELIKVMAGDLTCAGDDGSKFALAPGDAMIFPRGWTGMWSMRTSLRKVYVTWEAW